MVDLGFQDPKTTWNAYKTREKNSQHHHWPRYSYKTEEKTPKGQMVPISRAHALTGGGGDFRMLANLFHAMPPVAR